MNLINLSKLADSEANAPQLFSAVYTNKYIKKKVASRSQLYADPKGRSMVEMLGVLAIVGVLSVGAIAGYSKAMRKYRLDKAVSEYNLLLTTAIEKITSDSSVFTTDSGGTLWYTSVFTKAGWFPDSFKTYPKSDFAYDNFGNGVWIFKYPNKQIGIGIELNHNTQLCQSLFNLAKEWRSDLHYALTDDGNVTNYAEFYGDKACSSEVTCLANVTLNNIDTACSPCEKKRCRFYFIVNKF